MCGGLSTIGIKIRTTGSIGTRFEPSPAYKGQLPRWFF